MGIYDWSCNSSKTVYGSFETRDCRKAPGPSKRELSVDEVFYRAETDNSYQFIENKSLIDWKKNGERVTGRRFMQKKVEELKCAK